MKDFTSDSKILRAGCSAFGRSRVQVGLDPKCQFSLDVLYEWSLLYFMIHCEFILHFILLGLEWSIKIILNVLSIFSLFLQKNAYFYHLKMYVVIKQFKMFQVRHLNEPKDERKSPFCRLVEGEDHFLSQCYNYTPMRNELLGVVEEKNNLTKLFFLHFMLL